MTVAFVDCETTGLDPDLHEIWEVALIVQGAEFLWQLPVDLGRADLIALNIGGFMARRWPQEEPVSDPRRGAWLGHAAFESCVHASEMALFAKRFATLTWGLHLVGAVPSFDEERLRRLLRRHGACPGWHYHLVDVEALVAGKLGIPPPWNSTELSSKAGVDPGAYSRHSAMGDARWAKGLYESVFGPTPSGSRTRPDIPPAFLPPKKVR